MKISKRDTRSKHNGYGLVKKYRENKLDRRTQIGRYIADMKKSIIENIGSPTPQQRILLELITQKIIFIKAIGDYSRQAQIVNEQGVLLPVLSKNYLGYANSLRRDLEVLCQLQEIKKGVASNLAQENHLRGILGPDYMRRD